MDHSQGTLALEQEAEGMALSPAMIQDSLTKPGSDTADPEVPSDQPTLTDILRAVPICTASNDMLKDQFGGLRESVLLNRQGRRSESTLLLWKAESVTWRTNFPTW